MPASAINPPNSSMVAEACSRLSIQSCCQRRAPARSDSTQKQLGIPWHDRRNHAQWLSVGKDKHIRLVDWQRFTGNLVGGTGIEMQIFSNVLCLPLASFSILPVSVVSPHQASGNAWQANLLICADNGRACGGHPAMDRCSAACAALTAPSTSSAVASGTRDHTAPSPIDTVEQAVRRL